MQNMNLEETLGGNHDSVKKQLEIGVYKIHTDINTQ
jgi:hypothetical protein